MTVQNIKYEKGMSEKNPMRENNGYMFKVNNKSKTSIKMLSPFIFVTTLLNNGDIVVINFSKHQWHSKSIFCP